MAPERGLKDLDSPRLSEVAARDLIGGEDAGRGLRGIGKLSSTIAETGAAARTAWEGSRLLRIGGLVAGGLVLGTVGGIVGAGVAVALVTGLVVYGVTKNKDKTIKAMLHMGREAIMPDDAIAAFKQGKILHGLDLTFGISSAIQLVKYVAKGGIHLAGEFIKNPHAAMHEVAEAAGKTEKAIAATVDIGAKILADHKASAATAQTASDMFTSENTGGVQNLLAAVSKNKCLSAEFSRVTGSGLNVTPQLAMTGSRRPKAANDEVGLAYNNDNGPLPDHPSFAPDSHLHDLRA